MPMIVISDEGRIDHIIEDPMEFDGFFQYNGVRVISVLDEVDIEAQTIGGKPIAELIAKHGLPARKELFSTDRISELMKPKPDTSGPNDQERKVVKHLVDAWNSFLALPIEHNDDIDEFRRSIHAAQEKILARPGRRAINDKPVGLV